MADKNDRSSQSDNRHNNTAPHQAKNSVNGEDWEKVFDNLYGDGYTSKIENTSTSATEENRPDGKDWEQYFDDLFGDGYTSKTENTSTPVTEEYRPEGKDWEQYFNDLENGANVSVDEGDYEDVSIHGPIEYIRGNIKNENTTPSRPKAQAQGEQQTNHIEEIPKVTPPSYTPGTVNKITYSLEQVVGAVADFSSDAIEEASYAIKNVSKKIAARKKEKENRKKEEAARRAREKLAEEKAEQLRIKEAREKAEREKRKAVSIPEKTVAEKKPYKEKTAIRKESEPVKPVRETKHENKMKDDQKTPPKEQDMVTKQDISNIDVKKILEQINQK